MFKLKINESCLLSKIFLSLGVFFLLNIVLTENVLAYNPPIGIPDPGIWGDVHPVDSVAPDISIKCPSWPSAQATNCYYVDNTSSNATDDDNQYGYPDKPRLTIPNIVYSAGSYVEVHGGPYTNDYTYLRFNCSEEEPCWFRGTENSMPIFLEKVIIEDSSFLFVDFLDFNGGDSYGGLSINGYGNNIAIRNSQFRNKVFVGNSAGIGITPDLGETIHDVVIYNCNFEELGDWQEADSDPDYHGVVSGLWGRDSTTEEYNIWILGNTFYHLSGNGVQVNAGNWDDSYKYLHHIYIGDNTAHALRQAGFWSKQASDVIMSENVVYDNRKHGSQMGDCFGYQYRPNNLWIMFNECYDTNFGIRQSDDSYGDMSNTSYIVGNVFHDINPEDLVSYDPDDPWRMGVAISLWTGGMNRYVVDNTMSNCYNGINAIQSGEGSTLKMSGNLISDIDQNSWHVFMFQNVVDDADIDYTMMYDAAHDARVRWGDDTHKYFSVADFVNSESGECIHCLSEANPLFVDVNANNFNLQASSPVRDVGVESEVYDIFNNLYGINIKKSFDNIPRPQGSAWDIGAYEYIVRSDVDRSGGVVTTDAMLTLRNSLNLDMSLTNWQTLATIGDVNCDGVSNSTDAMLILRYSLGLSVSGTGWCEE